MTVHGLQLFDAELLRFGFFGNCAGKNNDQEYSERQNRRPLESWHHTSVPLSKKCA